MPNKNYDELLVRANKITSAALSGLTHAFRTSAEGRTIAKMLDVGKAILVARPSDQANGLYFWMLGPTIRGVANIVTVIDRLSKNSETSDAIDTNESIDELIALVQFAQHNYGKINDEHVHKLLGWIDRLLNENAMLRLELATLREEKAQT